jgi:phytoene dehydrogenase-like protein
MRDEPCALTYFLREPVTILGKERDHLNLEIYHFDPSLAPEGKTAVKVLFDASYSRWKELRKDREQYDVGKRKVADTVVGALEERFPGISRQVEMVDVATPVTIERYTGSYHGLQAEVPKGKAMSILTGGWCPTLPGLRNFRMVGQWAGGLGISTGAIGGRQLVKRLCKEDGKAFR